MTKNIEMEPFYRRLSTLVDYSSITGLFTWRMNRSHLAKKGNVAGSLSEHGYIRISVCLEGKQKLLSAHRLAWLVEYNELPDVINHINHIRHDNRIINLESGTSQHNAWDMKISNTNKSGFKGVSWSKHSNKWRSTIYHFNKQVNIGYFDCPKEASEAYEAKAKELRGDRYRNFNKSDNKTGGKK
tara:strand:+ start:487 stop:1041 length:555 start_codon:yes stop_codon:yes gene_type:complete